MDTSAARMENQYLTLLKFSSCQETALKCAESPEAAMVIKELSRFRLCFPTNNTDCFDEGL